MTTILYSRVSKLTTGENTFCLSLDSQEQEIIKFMRSRNLSLYKILKDIGSAFSKPQTDLKNLLKTCKNKLLLVVEPSRLSRNITNFSEIFAICKTNKHSIGFVNTNIIYDCNIPYSYDDIFALIQRAQQESIDMGIRISRSLQYKKSKELKWGKMLDIDGNITDNNLEMTIYKLIHLLNTSGSSIKEIKKLITEVGKMEGKEEFQIIEIINGKEYPMFLQNIPYKMSVKNITDTLNVYEVPRRKYKWSDKYVNLILKNESFDFELSKE